MQLQSNEAEVSAQRMSATLAPIFGYHQYNKFAATVAGCVGSLGADCTQGFIDFFSDYFQQLADTVLRSLVNVLQPQITAYQNAANTLQDLAGTVLA